MVNRYRLGRNQWLGISRHDDGIGQNRFAIFLCVPIYMYVHINLINCADCVNSQTHAVYLSVL
jgi:hypothetical protein